VSFVGQDGRTPWTCGERLGFSWCRFYRRRSLPLSWAGCRTNRLKGHLVRSTWPAFAQDDTRQPSGSATLPSLLPIGPTVFRIWRKKDRDKYSRVSCVLHVIGNHIVPYLAGKVPLRCHADAHEIRTLGIYDHFGCLTSDPRTIVSFFLSRCAGEKKKP
jgi:hypothetical protein